MAEDGYKVSLNVYDLSQGLARQLSTSFLGKAIEGIWHTGVVVYDKEYYFGGGIQHSLVGSTPYGTPIRTVDLGVTHVPKDVFEMYLQEIGPRYTAETYSLLTHNCNNFSNEVAQFLVGATIPDYILNLPNEVMSSPMGALINDSCVRFLGIATAVDDFVVTVWLFDKLEMAEVCNSSADGYKVSLNVYDLSQGLARQLSTSFLGKAIEGIWHTGVVVYDKEYYFGGGIQHSLVGSTPYGTPIRTVDLGVTHVPKDVFEMYLQEIGPRYTAETYSLLTHNCNNFSNEVAQFLVGATIPDYILNLPNEVMSSPMGALISKFSSLYIKCHVDTSYFTPVFLDERFSLSKIPR
ncbi:unnamed protein product [Ilex paraguariensis]|uniref:PPPDE domain-containing protein n=1 Tax=Ilex paraguariensis TaxID=185542 RepID=A0ABC8T2P6_9AQUA